MAACNDKTALSSAPSEGLLHHLLLQTNCTPEEEGFRVAREGLVALLDQLASTGHQADRVDKGLVDHLIVEIDRRVSEQIDLVLHDEHFQRMESAWRSVKFLVDRVDFRENIKLDLLNVSKADLQEDFTDAPKLTKSGLYQLVYTQEYGQFGGEPYGAIIGNYDFTHHSADLQLLKNIASVSSMSHAPFLTAAHPKFLGVDHVEKLPALKDVKAIFEGQAYAKWRAFRAQEDARYVGLSLPRFLLRAPFDPEHNPVRGFHYRESMRSHEDYLWGNSAFALASRLADSFARYRWCPNIIGPTSGGALSDLPVHYFESMGEWETKIPTEVLIPDRREYELAQAGFIPLSFRKGSDHAVFFSAQSAQQPKLFSKDKAGKQAELNYKLGAQLPYMFIVCRIAHYLKVLQREQLGSWKEAVDLERELNKWINQYVADQENAPATVRSSRPLRHAVIRVEAIENEPGWYKVDIQIRPHFKYMGADITLSLAGRIANRQAQDA